jgi:hypothetical protein
MLLDPRFALVAAGAAVVSSERVRKTVGKGAGYAATGAMKVGGPVIRPIVDAGRDIVDEARSVASHDSASTRATSRSRSTS